MSIPAELRYTSSHEWVRRESDGSVSVGISFHAQEQLGDMVYVDLPKPGRRLQQGEACAVVESVKAASDIYAPVAGEVLAANAEVEGAPERINEDAYGAWLFRMKPDDPAQVDGLLDAAGYAAVVAAEER